MKAQEAVAKAQETLRHEEALFQDGEAHLVARGVSQKTTVPSFSSDSSAFCNELATLRDQELHRRDEMKAELCEAEKRVRRRKPGLWQFLR